MPRRIVHIPFLFLTYHSCHRSGWLTCTAQKAAVAVQSGAHLLKPLLPIANTSSYLSEKFTPTFIFLKKSFKTTNQCWPERSLEEGEH